MTIYVRRTSTSEAYLTQIRFEPGAGSKCIKRMEQVYRVPYEMYLKPIYYWNEAQFILIGVVSRIEFEFDASEIGSQRARGDDCDEW